MDDGEAEEEVAGGDPSLGDDVFAQERDDNGATAEYYGTSEVEVCEKGKAAGGVWVDGVENEGSDEGGDEKAKDAGANNPGHGGEVGRTVGFEIESLCAIGSWGVAASRDVEGWGGERIMAVSFVDKGKRRQWLF